MTFSLQGARFRGNPLCCYFEGKITQLEKWEYEKQPFGIHLQQKPIFHSGTGTRQK